MFPDFETKSSLSTPEMHRDLRPQQPSPPLQPLPQPQLQSQPQPESTAFRLLGLPLDLKLYVASFFWPHQAVKLLTVSSEFHGMFSRTVWYQLSTNYFNVTSSYKSIGVEAWSRYGHLVHSFIVSSGYPSAISISELMPNIMRVRVCLGKAIGDSGFSFDQLCMMHNLRMITLEQNSETTLEVVDSAIGWCNNYSQNGHVKIIKWNLLNSAFFFNRIVVNISDLRRHRFGLLTYEYSLSQDICPRIHSLITSVHFFKVSGFRSLFHCTDNTGDPFRLLTTIELIICCTQHCDFGMFTPAIVPSLKWLCLNKQDVDCKPNTDSPFARIMSHSWPGLLTLKVHDSTESNSCDVSIIKIPSLTRFTCNVRNGTISLESILINMPHLIELTILKPQSLNATLLQQVPIWIRRLELSDVSIRSDILYFITTSAPRLHRLGLFNCSISEHLVSYALESANKCDIPVCELRLQIDGGRSSDSIINLISLFGQLRKVTVIEPRPLVTAIVQLQYPFLNVKRQTFNI